MAGQQMAKAVTGGRGRGPRGQQRTLSAGVRRCPIPRCAERIDPTRLMCRKHWYLVPKLMRDHVWATWRSGQAAFSPEHAEAVHAAMAAVLAATGLTGVTTNGASAEAGPRAGPGPAAGIGLRATTGART